jgi:hypothetical protein
MARAARACVSLILPPPISPTQMVTGLFMDSRMTVASWREYITQELQTLGILSLVCNPFGIGFARP